MIKQRIKILGYWDKEPIWRFMTSAEILAEELAKADKVYPIKLKVNCDDLETNIKINENN